MMGKVVSKTAFPRDQTGELAAIICPACWRMEFCDCWHRNRKDTLLPVTS